MSFELIASDIDAALNNIHQAEADHNMNTFFDELVESNDLSSSSFFSIHEFQWGLSPKVAVQPKNCIAPASWKKT